MDTETKIEKSIPEKITEKMLEKLSENGNFSQELISQLAEVDFTNVEAIKQLLLNQEEHNENPKTGNK
jgi:hypothetical protein